MCDTCKESDLERKLERVNEIFDDVDKLLMTHTVYPLKRLVSIKMK